MKRKTHFLIFLLLAGQAFNEARAGNDAQLLAAIDARIDEIENRTIEWRRHFHEHPELSNHEVETAKVIAKHLQDLGLEVETGVAGTGVVGVLKGGKPGPVIAFRADMDALPVTEQVDLPFASKVTTLYHGRETGVMHACGHDAHMAMLMATAEVLAGVRKDLAGTVKFIFQPAEEGAEDAETWGAEQMIREGVLRDPAPEVIFGLHVVPGPVGGIQYNPHVLMASVDNFRITVRGRGTHGSKPWSGTDPVLVGSAIVMNLQSIVSRNVPLTEGAAVVTVGSFHGGNRNNIIPDDVEMLGTIRTHNPETKELIHRRVREIVEKTAEAYGASAQVDLEILYPVTENHPEICEMMLPSLRRAAGEKGVELINPVMGAEDFSFFLKEIPGMYFFLGTGPEGVPQEEIEYNHSPRFVIDERALKTGIKAFCYLAVDYARLRKH
jgi:amidohydrolase